MATTPRTTQSNARRRRRKNKGCCPQWHFKEKHCAGLGQWKHVTGVGVYLTLYGMSRPGLASCSPVLCVCYDRRPRGGHQALLRSKSRPRSNSRKTRAQSCARPMLPQLSLAYWGHASIGERRHLYSLLCRHWHPLTVCAFLILISVSRAFTFPFT